MRFLTFWHLFISLGRFIILFYAYLEDISESILHPETNLVERPVDEADLMLKSEREIPYIPWSWWLDGHRRITALLPADISSVFSFHSEPAWLHRRKNAIHHGIVLTSVVCLPAKESSGKSCAEDRFSRSNRERAAEGSIWGTKAWVANRIRYPGSPCRKRWMLGVGGLTPFVPQLTQ